MHDSNMSSTLPSMSHLRTAKKAWAEAREQQKAEVLQVLLARAENFGWLIKNRYWRALDQQSGKSGNALREYYGNPEIYRLIAEYVPQLVAVFGSAAVTKELGQRLPTPVLRHLLALPELPKGASGGEFDRASCLTQGAPRPPPLTNVSRPPSISTRQEIDLIQMNALCTRLAPPRRTTLAHRIVFRLDQHFFGRSLEEKFHFIAHAFQFHAQRLNRIIQSQLRPRRAELNDPLLKVAVHGTGSLGDFFSHLIFIQEFSRKFGPMEIDFYAHPKKLDDAGFLFSRISLIKQVLDANFLPSQRHNYDVIVHLRYVVMYIVEDRERLLLHRPELCDAIAVADTRLKPYRFVFDNHPFFDGLFARDFSPRGMNLADVVGYLGNVSVDRNTLPIFKLEAGPCEILERYGLAHKRYVTVHDGFDTSYVPLGATVTKCWPKEHWRKLVSLMKAHFPDVLIVQVGSFNAQLIDRVDLDLRSKTNLDEAAWVIKHASLHVDGESGLVRLAHAVHTRSVVIFGPTSQTFFGFERNINLQSEVCNDCWWSTSDWLSHCPRGLEKLECMELVTPATVYEEIAACLNLEGSARYAIDQFTWLRRRRQ